MEWHIHIATWGVLHSFGRKTQPKPPANRPHKGPQKPQGKQVAAQCPACGRWGHAQNTCWALAQHMACHKCAEKHPDNAEKIYRAWIDQNSENGHRLIAQALANSNTEDRSETLATDAALDFEFVCHEVTDKPDF